MLRHSCAKTLDKDYDDKENIKDRVIEVCLELATFIPGFANIDKYNIVYWLQKYVNEEGFEHLSDSDITARYGSTSTPSTSQQADFYSE